MINHIIVPWRRSGRKLIVRNEPVNRMAAIQSEINHIFDQLIDESFGLAPLNAFSGVKGEYLPNIDVSEDKKNVKVSVDLPGVDEKDIEVTLNRNVLEIHGEKRAEKEENLENYHTFERSYGSFYRSIALPCEVDGDCVDAVYQKGVLTITLPKTKNAESKRIAVKTK